MSSFNLPKYWRENHNGMLSSPITGFVILNHIVCADGFTLSVQASTFHYSWPRAYVANGEYETWEVMAPSDFFDLDWFEYWDGCGVYGYVPTRMIEELVNKHNTLLLTYEPERYAIASSQCLAA